MGVEPYASAQVTPSGVFAPVVVTVANGSNAERDILTLRDEIVQPHPGRGSTYATPTLLPAGGEWGSWISGYGATNFFQFTAQANSVTVTSLNETGRATEAKLLPVIGIWQLSDQNGNPAPASTPSPFNSSAWGTTRLDAQFGTTDTCRVGIADFRGDGRPDYFYQASLLYSDNLTPSRLSLAGGITTLTGIGFKPGMQVAIGGNNGSVLSAAASQIEVSVPAASQDGIASLLPSAENVGPCDVFIAVSAGLSLVQFQMESLASIVPAAPKNGPNSHPTSPIALSFEIAAPTAPSAGVALFAVPEADSTNKSLADSHVSTSAEPADQASSIEETLAASDLAVNQKLRAASNLIEAHRCQSSEQEASGKNSGTGESLRPRSEQVGGRGQEKLSRVVGGRPRFLIPRSRGVLS